MQAFQLKFIEGVVAVGDWVRRVFFLLLNGFDVHVESLRLVALKLFQLARAFHHLGKLASEGRNLDRLAWVENEVHDSTVGAFNQTRLFSTDLLGNNLVLDPGFGVTELVELVSNDPVEKGIGVLRFLSVSQH